MITVNDKPKIILIGGTSHIGKSTLAETLALKLGWRCVSTDKLARHPGRPWRPKPNRVPDHVAEHYLGLSVEELMTDVLRHYKNNVWPMVEHLVISHAQEGSKEGLVLEGSALWPELVVALGMDNVSAVWLTAGNHFIEGRIRKESHYEEKTAREKEMIDKFLARTLVYNGRMMKAVKRLGLVHIDVETVSSLEQLSEWLCLNSS